MSDEPLVPIERPAEFVQRLTLSRPKKRNALSTEALSARDQELGDYRTAHESEGKHS